jgi:hypothetical protein
MSNITKRLVSPWLYWRAASVLTLLFALGHSMGGLQSWSPIGETDTLRAMRAFQFDAGGARRTYLDFYLGFGWTLTAYLLLQSVILWQIANLARTTPGAARSMTVTMIVTNIAGMVLAAWFIFAVPAISFALIAACLAAALIFARWSPGQHERGA